MGKLGLMALALVMATGATTARAAERLQVPQLTGWTVVTSASDATGEVTELVPQAETPDTWTRRVTIQAFRGAKMTVAEFLDQVAERTAPVCEGATAGPASLGRVSGAPAGTRTVACGRYKGDGRGTFVLYYVIGGKAALYVVTRTWRGAPFDPAVMPISAEEMAEWTAYVNAIALCDTTAPGQMCR